MVINYLAITTLKLITAYMIIINFVDGLKALAKFNGIESKDDLVITLGIIYRLLMTLSVTIILYF